MSLKPSLGIAVLLGTSLLAGCDEPAPTAPSQGPSDPHDHDLTTGPPDLAVENLGPIGEPSVADLDRPTVTSAAGNASLPVEAKLLLLSANGSEPELDAIRSVLDYRGVPYDVFVANVEPALTASRLRSGDLGLYQGTILMSSALAISGTSALSASEWTALADYEQAFVVRRAVLAASPDPALGFGSSTSQNTTTTPLTVRCTTAGQSIFRDVNCVANQQIAGDSAYLATPVSGAPLTPLLTDTANHALAAIHLGSDGRESLLLLFRQQDYRVHSQQFLHGALGWVSGGTYLGERRIDISAQVDDTFLASDLYGGGTYRITDGDLRAARSWLFNRRAQAITPNFRVTHAFNGVRAIDGDLLTDEARAQSADWDWVSHTFRHRHLDNADYAIAHEELTSNIQTAADVPLIGFDVRSLVTPNVSGLVNPGVMQAAIDVGVRFAVTDTSKPGCDSPPNLAFYNALAPAMLLIPRRPTNLFYNVSTPAQWMAEYNAFYRAHFGRDSTYAQILDQESDVLLQYLMRGEADPWMFHQANLRAYDGVHSLLSDLIDATLTKLGARLRVPVRTQPMTENGNRFARRVNFEGAGVRATLFRGRALVIDTGRSVTLPITGVRDSDGESYGGDVIGMFDVSPGTTRCIPLDSAGQGCSPAPVRSGGAGPVTSLPRGYCDGTGTAGLPPAATVTAIPRGSNLRYWDRGGDLGTSWRARTFDDSGWSQGLGPIGYGETYLNTIVSYGPSASSKYVTTYVRRSFNVADVAAVTGLRGSLMYDDGVVVYLNGTEIGRAAMPAGSVTAATWSTGSEAHNRYSDFNWDTSRNLLVAGTNTIAVEVHQKDASSSDLVFDIGLVLETTGTSTPPPEPTPTPTPEPTPEPTPTPTPTPSEGGVPRGSTWFYWDNGGDLGTSWRTTSGGTGWDSGAGPLGYGETYLATTVSYGPNWASKYTTTYFTKTFNVTDPGAVVSMLGDVMYDDGFVAYLNGNEIGRAKMPSGSVTASTFALSGEANNAYERFDWTALRGQLRAGSNVLAVEIHQKDADSSDLVFDLALVLTTSAPSPTPTPTPQPSPSITEDIARGSAWRYWGAASAPSAADIWATPTFDDAAWVSGAAPLGYGETFIATQIPYGSDPNNKPITTYFRRWFRVDSPSSATTMVAQLLYDDGAVVHLNGREIARLAMPTGTIEHTTRSPGHEGGYETFNWSAFASYLVPGNNLLSVEIHQAAPSSSDLSFDLSLDVGN